MKEEFVQFLWAEELILPSEFKLEDNRAGKVLARGKWNHNSGPDFKDAIVQIDRTTWVGHVEMHLKASDWFAHGHHTDPAYSNVILHVVVKSDAEVHDFQGRTIPVLVVPEEEVLSFQETYDRWLANKGILPCSGFLAATPGPLIQTWLMNMAEERYKRRVEFGWEVLESTKGNVELTHWILLARIMGAPTNSDSMEMLMRRLPIISIRRKTWSWDDFEKWVMAVSGLSGEMQTTYQQKVFGVEPMSKAQWTWGRLRPPSFPEQRVRQFAWVFYSRMIEGSQKLFWKTSFWEPFLTGRRPGKSTLETWHLNMVPYLGLGSWTEGWTSAEKWRELVPEKNHVTKIFEDIGLSLDSALESQALLEIHQEYCQMKKCLNCAVGKYHLIAKDYDRKDQG
ncbi:DUF2851 family protein [Phaeocystidibacter luteus]|uniref:DUF2851 family protein n=1 Tax=Phaeocystidibacter luteus TaxID=911197 RepID=A0A6N6REZ0_9FLAO|nr:DUF2851 family protein [Phaeocystidibacter luteus]KAB2809737.1 DUF2851 family protein [Phaeocystidibacter luteus]